MRLGLVFFGFVLIVCNSCGRSDEPVLDPLMSSSSDMVCKNQGLLKDESIETNQTCVYWDYTEDGLFTMTHYNAGFNCCPEAILSSMTVSGDTIYIVERDSMQLCRCNCLYDIDFVISNLQAKKYVVSFDEPFVIEPKVPLVFEIDLENDVSGKYCEFRDFYPWL